MINKKLLTIALSLFLISSALVYGIVTTSVPQVFAVVPPVNARPGGITGTEGTKAIVDLLGIKWIYNWTAGSIPASSDDGSYQQLVTMRMGDYWWTTNGYVGNIGNPTCDRSFTDGSRTYLYNECKIKTDIDTRYNSLSSEPVKYFVIGNEPNINALDSDGAVPTNWNAAFFQANQYKILYDLIKAKDTNIKIVGPSTIGFTQNGGQTWFTNFMAAYRGLPGTGGANPPMDIMNHHMYDTALYYHGTNTISNDVNSPYDRRADATIVLTELDNFKNWRDTISEYAGKPIFITEFGILNCVNDIGTPAVTKICYTLKENSGATAVHNYLNTVIDGLLYRRVSHNIQRWMLFSLQPETFSGVRNDVNHTPTTFQTTNPVVLANSAKTALTSDTGVWYQAKVQQSFWDVPYTSPYFSFVETMRANGITMGCNDGTSYCPGTTVTRKEMSAFIIRAIEKTVYAGLTPPSAPASDTFVDIQAPTYMTAGEYATFRDYIEKMKMYGVSVGCTDTAHYCPSNPVTRKDMATFITRAIRYRIPATPTPTLYPTPATYTFDDVRTDRLYVEQVNSMLISTGYTTTPRTYGPNDPVTRDQMAKFIDNAFFHKTY